MQKVKLVAVGDGPVGKSCLLLTYRDGKFPNLFLPTVFDSYSKDVQFNNETISVMMFDTGGQVNANSVKYALSLMGDIRALNADI